MGRDRLGSQVRRKTKTALHAHGVKCLLSPHPEIRKLKRRHCPGSHGNKVWKSSWMLMDYLDSKGAIADGAALDIGCGWGLTGIFLSKRFNAKVTGIDIDSEVLPYLQLHADINQTEVRFLNKGFDQIRVPQLRKVDVMVGADICFWDELIDPLRKLINRARRADVKQVFIADPGRPTFDDMAEPFLSRHRSELIDWEIETPVYTAGKILRIDFQNGDA